MWIHNSAVMGLWQWDIETFRAINVGLHREWLTPLILFISKTGDFQWPALTLIIFCFFRQHRGWALYTLLAASFAGLVRLAVESMVNRQRPGNLDFTIQVERIMGDSSWPSGHTTTSFALAFAVFLLWRKSSREWVALTVLVWAALVGFARIYVGAHYPLDIVGGILLAFLCVVGWDAWYRAKIGPAFERKGWIAPQGAQTAVGNESESA